MRGERLRAEGAAGKIPVAPHVDNYVSVDPERSAIQAPRACCASQLGRAPRPHTTKRDIPAAATTTGTHKYRGQPKGTIDAGARAPGAEGSQRRMPTAPRAEGSEWRMPTAPRAEGSERRYLQPPGPKAASSLKAPGPRSKRT